MLQIVGALILLIAGFAILRLLFRALISTASALAGLILLCLFGPALLAGYITERITRLQEGNRLHYLADRAGIRGLFSDADAYHLDQAFPLLMKQLELMLTSGELNPRHQHTVTLYAKGLTCKADTLSSCGYVYLAVYPTPEMKN